MQQSDGLLLATGWTVATPYIVPCGHNGNESHDPPRRSKMLSRLKKERIVSGVDNGIQKTGTCAHYSAKHAGNRMGCRTGSGDGNPVDT